MLVAVDFDGAVVGAVVREMEETFGLGAEACPTQAFSPSSSGAGASWP